MPIKAVVFDFGGVLLRTEDRVPRARLADRLGMTYEELDRLVFDSPSAIQAMRGGITAGEHWHELQKKLGMTEAEIEQVQVEFWAGDVLDQNLVSLLRELRPRYATVLLSNAWDDLRKMIEEVYQFADAFDRMFISSEIGMVKPDLAIFRWVISQLEIEPSQAVFVDDFPHNVAGARAAGWQAIHFQSADQVLDELRALLGGE